MTKKERYQYIIHYFEQHAPHAETELVYANPYQLLVAVILSAQCTDKRVNLTTPALFNLFPTPQHLAEASIPQIFNVIKSISYPNNKALHLKGMATLLVEKFKSEVPLTVVELMQLPGVGRKTANVITSVIAQQPNMAVDTHVFRVSNRIGLVNSTSVLKTELELIKHIPKEKIHKAHHWLILHGRYTCIARAPKCTQCGIATACKYFVQKKD